MKEKTFFIVFEGLMFGAKIKKMGICFKEKIAKASKGISLIKKLQNKCSRNTLLTIYGSFVRLQVAYGNVLHDQSGRLEKSNIMLHLPLLKLISALQVKSFIRS